MNTPVALGVDLGTQQLKVIAVDCATSRILGSVNTSIENISDSAGAMEQRPLQWWTQLCGLINRLMRETGIQPGEIAGIGLSGHMHSIVPLDENLSPVHNCIVWADTRAVNQAREVSVLENVTLWNPSIAAYSTPKVIWLRENAPESFSRVRHILFPKDYLRLRMTGQISTDFSDASGTLAWDFASRRWDPTILSAVNIPVAVFPQPRASSQLGGTLSPRAADEMGLRPGIPVAIGAGDVAAAVIGSGVSNSNTLLINAGTAAQVIVIQEKPQPYQHQQGVRYLFELGIDGKVFAMGALPSAGLSLEWWRGIVGPELTYQDLDVLAEQARSGPDGVLFVPYLQGSGTPHLLDGSLGAFVQLSAGTDTRSMTRAVMEGVAFGIKHCAESLVAEEGLGKLQVQVTGGITKSALMRELLASIFPGPITFREYSDVSAIGAAALGAVAGHVAEDIHSFLGRFDFGSRPHVQNQRERYELRYARFKQWSDAVTSSRTGHR